MAAAKKKTYYPAKTFDDALVALSQLMVKNSWALVDLSQLEKDAQEQREQRAKYDALRTQFLSEHEAFGVAQSQRYKRFAAALNAARGAFRDDKAAIAALLPFKRVIRRKSSTQQAA
jgi:hypothetical protein